MLESILSQAFIVGVLAGALRVASPILLAAVGEIYAERSGIINVGVEGQMLTGALFGFLGAYYSGNLWLGLLVGSLSGALIASVVGFMCVSLFSNQVVTGVAVNLFCLGMTTFLYRTIFGVSMDIPTTQTMHAVDIPLLSNLPYLGPILFQQKVYVYLTLAIAGLAAVFLYKTTWGLNVRAVGEHPTAAETGGVSVVTTRYLCILLGGFLAGLGGAVLSVGEVGYFTMNMTAGRGFMALAIVVFGAWDPLRATGAALLFGAADALQRSLQAIGVGLPPQLMLSIPYLLPIVALAFASGRSRAPAMLATPYKREE
jgi:general nucleoside transport system permease protein